MGAQPFCSILPDSGHPLADRAFSHAQRLGNLLLLPALLLEGQRLPPSRFLPVGGSWKSFCHASSYHGQKSLEIYATVSKGELLLGRGIMEGESRVRKQAEACFRQAVEVSRRQSAKSWELRATMSLARLLA